jgi:hypothetical protein
MATYAGGIDSLESIHGLLKRIQIRTQVLKLLKSSKNLEKYRTLKNHENLGKLEYLGL